LFGLLDFNISTGLLDNALLYEYSKFINNGVNMNPGATIVHQFALKKDISNNTIDNALAIDEQRAVVIKDVNVLPNGSLQGQSSTSFTIKPETIFEYGSDVHLKIKQ
jgi:hypothetical protein